MTFPTDEQEQLAKTWYRKYATLHTKIWTLHKESYQAEKYEYEIAFRGLTKLLDGLHAQMSGLLSEQTSDVQILVNQLEKTYEFIENMLADLKEEWEAAKQVPDEKID